MAILTQLIEFILLKRKLEDINYSQTAAVIGFLAHIVVGYFALEYLLNSLAQFTETQPELQTPVQTTIKSVIFVLFIYMLFEAKERPERFVQSAIALFGSSTILSIVIIAMSVFPGSLLLMTFLVVWQIVLTVRILMEALDYNPLVGFLSYFGIDILSTFISTAIYSFIV